MPASPLGAAAFRLTEHTGLCNTNMGRAQLYTNYTCFFIEHYKKTLNYTSMCIT